MKLLVIKTSSMGDVIHTLPALYDATHAVSALEIDWVVEETFADIPKLIGSISRIIPVALRRWRKNWLQAIFSGEVNKFIRELRKQKYDYIIDAQGLIKSAILTKIARGKSYGFNFKSAREPLASVFYTHRFPVAKDEHAIIRLRKLFALAFGYACPTFEPNYGLSINTFPDKSNKKIVFIHGTSRSDKCWPEEKWIELAKLAAASGYDIFLPWGSALEFKRAQRIAESCSRTKVLPRMNLLEIANFLATSSAIITVDTGLGHLAAALGVPTIALYGPTDPKLIGTIGKNQRHVLDFLQAKPQQIWLQLGVKTVFG